MMPNPYVNDFPLLADRKVAYLDSAATSQKPRQVIEAMSTYYSTFNASPHRGLYTLSVESTRLYEQGRSDFASFIHAKSPQQIVFLRNGSEALNLLALSYGLTNVGEGDEVVIPISEHHSNLVPWQQVCKQRGARLMYMDINSDGSIDEAEIERKITKRTKIVSFAQVGNVMGVELPAAALIAKAHAVGAVAIVDCTQSIAHMQVDVTSLDCDFAVFSSHKMYGPAGLGMLYGKSELLENLPVLFTGGDMVSSVSKEGATFAEVPQRFETGTQDVAAVVGLSAAIAYLHTVGYAAMKEREDALVFSCLTKLARLPWITVHGVSDPKGGRKAVIAFSVEGIHPHDVASLLDSKGVAIRAGHHCAQPLMHYLGVGSTCRVSFGLYNDEEDIDRLIDALQGVRRVFGYAD